MRTPTEKLIIISIACFLSAFVSQPVLAQKSKTIYHKDWIDLNKNGKKDIYETPTAPIEARIADLLSQMTVEENLEMGAYTQPKSGIADGIADVYRRFPRLEERRKQTAGTLSGGEQQMLAMGRALMSKPKLLMLDEPSMGLAPILVEQIFDIIRELHAAGTTILLVEQNANAALSVANRAYVLETGRIVLSGTGDELMHSEQVQKAYLGG